MGILLVELSDWSELILISAVFNLETGGTIPAILHRKESPAAC